jgi:glycosyltransferase involved in cell wall biosynthesis
MACGKAIVTTPVGCAGLGLQDEYHVAIRQDWGEFAEAIGEILSERELRRGLGERARRVVENRFSWTAIADQAYGSYLTVAGEPVGVQRRSLSVA